MRWDPHGRRDGYLEAWRRLNRAVADDLDAGRGDIKPLKWFARRADPRKNRIGLFAAKVLRGFTREG